MSETVSSCLSRSSHLLARQPWLSNSTCKTSWIIRAIHFKALMTYQRVYHVGLWNATFRTDPWHTYVFDFVHLILLIWCKIWTNGMHGHFYRPPLLGHFLWIWCLNTWIHDGSLLVQLHKYQHFGRMIWSIMEISKTIIGAKNNIHEFWRGITRIMPRTQFESKCIEIGLVV